MKKEISALLLGVSIFEGCSSNSTPAAEPIKIYNIVNCQDNPMDDSLEIYKLNDGEKIKVGGITEQGEEDLILLEAKGKGKMNLELGSFSGSHEETEAIVENNNLLLIMKWGLADSQTIVAVSATCKDAVPNPNSF